MMRALATALIALYALTVVTVFGQSGATNPGPLFFGFALFTSPLLLLGLLAAFLRSSVARRLLSGFSITFCILALAMFAWTFGSEHDGLYQLALLLIPAVGIPSAIIVGMIATYLQFRATSATCD